MNITQPSTDSFFCIGHSHKICQDYSRTLTIQNFDGNAQSIGIVADGCSGVADSDVGSRLLLLSTLQEWQKDGIQRDWPNTMNLLSSSIKTGCTNAKQAATLLGLAPEAVTATVAVVTHDTRRNNVFYGAVYGDGALSFRTKKQELVVIEVQPPCVTGSMPAYPTYTPADLTQYMQETEGQESSILITVLDCYGRVKSKKVVLNLEDFTLEGTGRLTILCRKVTADDSTIWPRPVVSVEACGFMSASAWSDGVGTGSWKSDDDWSNFSPKPPEGAAGLVFDLNQIGNYRGNFMARKITTVSRQWRHLDDLSGATLCTEDAK